MLGLRSGDYSHRRMHNFGISNRICWRGSVGQSQRYATKRMDVKKRAFSATMTKVNINLD